MSLIRDGKNSRKDICDMRTIAELCKPRDSVFATTSREDVKDLTNLIKGDIDGEAFFNENFMTEGMKVLVDIAIKRYRGETDTGVVKLTQAMGGGKTHNMIALALLSQNAELRSKVLGRGYEDIGDVKVIAFTGRESDTRFGIWGSLAEQLGKKEMFKDYYSPLQAPGQTAWVNLLANEKVLILLDELPPYLEVCHSTTVGNSDLSVVTTAALTNLFNAMGQEALKNVLLVFSDLKATYESGSQLLQTSFKNLENEANRVAINIEPVALNSDEIYNILRTRLFAKLPNQNSEEVVEVAMEYKAALEAAEQAGYTNQSASARYAGVKDSYPFHPAVKELYARFRENPNFQQTRGLLKLMRQIIREFYESGKAENAYLINVYDLNLNASEVLSHISTINSSLANAISHDIAQNGKAVAEIVDAKRKTEGGDASRFPYAQNLARLIFMSSLNEVKLGINGLNTSEIYGYLCEPHTDLGQYKRVMEELTTQFWYLKMDAQGRYYFQNTKNMVAQINTYIESYGRDRAKESLIRRLETMFKPITRECYEKLYVMPALDKVSIERDKVALIIFEPYVGGGINPDLLAFYENSAYKNRMMFLSGTTSMMEKLYENSKKLMAVEQIIKDMRTEGTPENDQQYREALDQQSKAWLALFTTVRDTFVTLWFPVKNGLTAEEIKFNFTTDASKADAPVTMNGEQHIINTVGFVQKYASLALDDASLDVLRRKCENRLFTQKEMPWNTILERAASETSWQWLHRDQMKELRDMCMKKDLWREVGGYIVKGPFEKEPTSVTVQQEGYNPDTKEFTLRVAGHNGSSVYYEVGAVPTSASARLDGTRLITKEVELDFICIDDDGEGEKHPTGPSTHFVCEAPIRYAQRGTSSGILVELESHPKYEMRYTTDGSEPKENGAIYDGAFIVPSDCAFIRVVTLLNGRQIGTKDIAPMPIDNATEVVQTIDDEKPLSYKLVSPRKCVDTAETYAELDKMAKAAGVVMRGITVEINEKGNKDNYIEFVTGAIGTATYDPETLKATIDIIREMAFNQSEVDMKLSYKSIICQNGKAFKRWIDTMGRDMNKVKNEGEIIQ